MSYQSRKGTKNGCQTTLLFRISKHHPIFANQNGNSKIHLAIALCCRYERHWNDIDFLILPGNINNLFLKRSQIVINLVCQLIEDGLCYSKFSDLGFVNWDISDPISAFKRRFLFFELMASSERQMYMT